LEITEEGTTEEDSDLAYHNKEVVEEEDVNPEVDMTLQPERDLPPQTEEDTINLKMNKLSHKGEDSMDREVLQHQSFIQIMANRQMVH
jgi:hypothetical protein